MNDKDAINAALNQWLTSLDSGNLQGMLDTCDPEVVVANENTPTTIGLDAIRDKYAPRIAALRFKSGFETEHLAVYGDFAVLIGHFEAQTTNKKTGEIGGGSGRLGLIYRRHPDGSWKMLLDMDNNA
ncbi:YybH family protein [Denitrobaculum tricleocarpae]|uniref:Nuclear transport factor 2 family protein n=1 Tax=Denitrobaculum tricleocarpae TaxID=2591009 RepID=A0A545T7Q0_9PROT|nr:DUF4440 domain-containing protein [Denitrobaculum tricleocarpae]TQV73256.1 nuclear transport factor 2 family protein [Denitrobaculum tricleocarpae]